MFNLISIIDLIFELKRYMKAERSAKELCMKELRKQLDDSKEMTKARLGIKIDV